MSTLRPKIETSYSYESNINAYSAVIAISIPTSPSSSPNVEPVLDELYTCSKAAILREALNPYWGSLSSSADYRVKTVILHDSSKKELELAIELTAGCALQVLKTVKAHNSKSAPARTVVYLED